MSDMTYAELTEAYLERGDAIEALTAEIARLKAGREIERTMIRNAVARLAEKDEAFQIELRNLIASDAATIKKAAKGIKRLTAERDEARTCLLYTSPSPRDS